MRLWIAILLLGLAHWPVAAATTNAIAPGATNATPQIGKFDAQFFVSPPYSSAGAICRRFSITFIGSAYTLSKERFRVIVPETYTNDLSWGLFVWMSPGHEPNIPKDW